MHDVAVAGRRLFDDVRREKKHVRVRKTPFFFLLKYCLQFLLLLATNYLLKIALEWSVGTHHGYVSCSSSHLPLLLLLLLQLLHKDHFQQIFVALCSY